MTEQCDLSKGEKSLRTRIPCSEPNLSEVAKVSYLLGKNKVERCRVDKRTSMTWSSNDILLYALVSANHGLSSADCGRADAGDETGSSHEVEVGDSISSYLFLS